jgi:hypothetical protein
MTTLISIVFMTLAIIASLSNAVMVVQLEIRETGDCSNRSVAAPIWIDRTCGKDTSGGRIQYFCNESRLENYSPDVCEGSPNGGGFTCLARSVVPLKYWGINCTNIPDDQIVLSTWSDLGCSNGNATAPFSRQYAFTIGQCTRFPAPNEISSYFLNITENRTMNFIEYTSLNCTGTISKNYTAPLGSCAVQGAGPLGVAFSSVPAATTGPPTSSNPDTSTPTTAAPFTTSPSRSASASFTASTLALYFAWIGVLAIF